LLWGGRPWTLELDHARPGLRRPGHEDGALLALEGVAAVGRSDLEALSGRSLVRVEPVHSRLEATFAPDDWGGLKVRASWSPSTENQGIDLEIQASASSVGELRAIEVYVTSRWFFPPSSAVPAEETWVKPRDAHAAVLSYDGREPASELKRLTTLPVRGDGEPLVDCLKMPVAWPDVGDEYLEMIHAHDVARRVNRRELISSAPPRYGASTRYGLFGHDLEKGVIIRGRLRGLWMPPGVSVEECRRAFKEFLALPPPLGP
jgi:hypothetical protein